MAVFVRAPVFADTGFADVDAELEQFAVDTRRSPKRVFAAHPANQLACFGRHPGTTAAAMAGFPLPVEAESLSVPGDVSGLTMISADRQSGQVDDSHAHRNRSEEVSFGRFTDRCRTPS